MKLPDRIETTRLVLRPPRQADARDIFDGYARDPEVTRWLAFRPHVRLSETKGFLRRVAAARKEGATAPWVVTRRGGADVVGMVEARRSGFKVELGYVLRRSEWGKGLMTEAVRAVSGAVLDDPEVFRVWAVCDVDNLASARVLEKSGFEREGVLRRFVLHPNVSAEPRDVVCFARTR